MAALRTRKRSTLRFRFSLILLAAVIPLFVLANFISLNSYRSNRLEMLAHIRNTTTILHNVYDSMLKSTVSTYLKSKVESGINLAVSEIDNYSISREEKLDNIFRTLQTLEVGTTGYFYGLDSKGIILFHPDENIVGVDLSRTSPVQQQLELTKGYLEYEWQNTYESLPKKKALYMDYIPELDLIITATSYREEFTSMIDQSTILNTVTAMEFGESGYSYVIESEDSFVAHPYYSHDDDRAFLLENDFKAVIREIFRNTDSFTTYEWRDSETEAFRKKIVFSRYIEDFDWVVATAMYMNELYKPLLIQLVINIFSTVAVSLLLSWLIRKMSLAIENPISGIYNTMKAAEAGNLESRTLPDGPAEIYELGINLNSFIQTLGEMLREKENLIREIQHRINNNLQTINSIISLHRLDSKDSGINAILLELNKKVTVISLVYESMLISQYSFSNDELLLPSYLNDYIDKFINSFGIDCSMFEIEINFEEIFIQRNMAICCGLIVNELITFAWDRTETDSNRLMIKLVQEGGRILLSVSDSSNSFSSTCYPSQMSRLSRTMIEVMLKQLSGEILPSSTDPDESDTVLSISFPSKTETASAF